MKYAIIHVCELLGNPVIALYDVKGAADGIVWLIKFKDPEAALEVRPVIDSAKYNDKYADVAA
jgi:hypothetical protein